MISASSAVPPSALRRRSAEIGSLAITKTFIRTLHSLADEPDVRPQCWPPEALKHAQASVATCRKTLASREPLRRSTGEHRVGGRVHGQTRERCKRHRADAPRTLTQQRQSGGASSRATAPDARSPGCGGKRRGGSGCGIVVHGLSFGILRRVAARREVIVNG